LPAQPPSFPAYNRSSDNKSDYKRACYGKTKHIF